MSFLAAVLLRTLHFFYAVFLIIYAHWKRLTCRKLSSKPRIPKHLALLFVAEPNPKLETALVESVLNAVKLSRAYGIEKLTIYEENGQVTKLSQQLKACFNAVSQNETHKQHVEDSLLPTPPLSDYSGSRPISPHDDPFMDTNTVTLTIPAKSYDAAESSLIPSQLTLCICSRKSAKPNLAAAASVLLSEERAALFRASNKKQKTSRSTLRVEVLEAMLESDNGLSPPDFMIVHPLDPAQYNRTPFELHGYPPWQIRLTEIYFDRYRSYKRFSTSAFGLSKGPFPLDEMTFRQALDEFSSAEMRFGK